MTPYRALLLNQFFAPDVSATAQIATELAEDLAADGVDLTVVTSVGSYLGGRLALDRDGERSYRVSRVKSTALGRRSTATRLADYGTFLASAAWKAVRERHFDVIVTMSTPPFLSTIGPIAQLVRGAAFVYWVQDLYPDIAIALGSLDGAGLPGRGLTRLGEAILRRADAVVVPGEAMARRLHGVGADSRRVRVIPNWADSRLVRPVPAHRNRIRSELGLGDGPVVMYAGNMGRAHDMSTLLSAVRAAGPIDTTSFIFAGAGVWRPAVEALAREAGNVRVLPYQPRDRLAEFLSIADVHVVSQHTSMLGLMEPSKLYSVLACGKPVLFIGPDGGEAARILESERVGCVVRNGDVAGVGRALEVLFREGQAMGRRARRLAEGALDRPQRTAAFAQLLREVAGNTSAKRSRRAHGWPQRARTKAGPRSLN